MERRMLLAIVLAVGTIIGWQYFFVPPPPKAKEASAKSADPAAKPGEPAPAPGAPPVPGAPPGAPAPGAPPAPPAPPAGPPPAQQAPHREFSVVLEGSEWHDVGFTTTGGAITYVRLENAYEESARDEPKRQRLDTILSPYPDQLTGMVALDEADTERMRSLDWTVDKETKEEVAFSFLTRNGLRVKKRFLLPTGVDRYDLDIVITVERVEAAASQDPKVSLRLLAVSGHVHEPAPQSISPTPIQAVRLVLGTEEEPLQDDPWKIGPYRVANKNLRPFRLVGASSQYFTTVLFSAGGPASPAVTQVWVQGGDASQRLAANQVDPATERLKEFYRARDGRDATGNALLAGRIGGAAWEFQRSWVEFDAPVAASGTAPSPATFHLYSGPLSRRVLAQDRYEPITGLIQYPFAFDYVARFLLWVFDRFRDLTGSAGIAIILMTLFVRFSMMPLSVRNQLSMRRHGRKIAKIKPKLEALKVKWAKDPRKFREEQVALFKEHGIGFPMGCIMIFLQIPIFMALFSSLRIEYGVRHESFLWITDLAGPDRLIPFSHALVGVFPPGGLWSLNILPLLYMGLSIWQQRLMPKPMDEQQAQQMKTARWMSIIFPVLLYNYTAALALYMVVSTTVAIVESRIVRAKDNRDAAAA